MVRVNIDRLHQIHNARCLQLWHGAGKAAKYLKNLGWSLEAALWILLGKESQ